MYKELNWHLKEKKVLEIEIMGLEKRIKHKIQKQLGLHASTFNDMKVECSTIDDKFTRVFAQVEYLDKQLIYKKEELEIVIDVIDKIYAILSNFNDRESAIYLDYNLKHLSTIKIGIKHGISDRQVRKILNKISGQVGMDKIKK